MRHHHLMVEQTKSDELPVQSCGALSLTGHLCGSTADANQVKYLVEAHQRWIKLVLPVPRTYTPEVT
eukprot:2877460-Pyramimonas_sp.AAC.1